MSDLRALLGAVPDDVLAICRRLREKNKRGWIVGGCVRDLLGGRAAKDWDVATDALPEEVVSFFSRVIPTGLQHGTVTVVIRGQHYEVTTLRGEGAYTDGRRPDEVKFVHDDIVADLARRDFTINAMAIDPVDGRLIDPFDGQRDLDQRVVRAVGEARERFAEDGLRVMRAARFAATLEFALDPETEAAMGVPTSIDTFRKVSAERVRDEWVKSMVAARPSTAFEILRRTGILEVTCPELLDSVGCEQNQWHAYDVWRHALECLDACAGDPILRVAALLHDVGKPRTREFSTKTNDYTFYEHERVGAEIAEPITQRLRFSNEERARIVGLVRHHLICYSPQWSDATVRRWLRRVSPELAADLYVLGRADALGKGRDVTRELEGLTELEARATRLIEEGAALTTRDLAVDGRDVMKELGIPPGRRVGEILAELLEVVVEDPTRNDREKLLAEIRQR